MGPGRFVIDPPLQASAGDCFGWHYSTVQAARLPFSRGGTIVQWTKAYTGDALSFSEGEPRTYSISSEVISVRETSFPEPRRLKELPQASKDDTNGKRGHYDSIKFLNLKHAFRGQAHIALHRVMAMIADLRLDERCKYCTLPRNWPQVCLLLSRNPEFVAWELSLAQLPFEFIGNYLSNLFFAYAYSHSLGLPFLVATLGSDAAAFEHLAPWLLRFAADLPDAPSITNTTRKKIHHLSEPDPCRHCTTIFPHECTQADWLWEEYAIWFAGTLASALKAMVTNIWPQGWPGEIGRRSHQGRSVAVHLRCGDFLGHMKRNYASRGLLPFSILGRVLRPGDNVVLITAASRDRDELFANTCNLITQKLINLMSDAFAVTVTGCIDQDVGQDLARLALADVVLCAAFSTFCKWGALAASALGADVYIMDGNNFASGSITALPVHWLTQVSANYDKQFAALATAISGYDRIPSEIDDALLVLKFILQN